MFSRKKIRSGKNFGASSSPSTPSTEPERLSPSKPIDQGDDEPAAGSPQSATETTTTTSHNKPGAKSSGPRTTQGKARSKHRIFSKDTLPEEKRQIRSLFNGYVEYFQLQGAPEFEMGAFLVQYQLEKMRIEQYALQEFAKAALNSVENQMQKVDAQLLFQFPSSEQGAQGVSCAQASPKMRAWLLELLKREVAKRGPRPSEDLKFLDSVYGGETKGKDIIFFFKCAELSQEKDADNKTKLELEKSLILVALEKEIKVQQILAAAQDDRERKRALGMVALPPEHILDRLSRYRAANGREFRRLLEGLEMIRRLRGGRKP